MKIGDKMALAENLRHLRELKGLTLEEIAESADVTKQAVNKYEQGKMIPNGIVLVDIAAKLGTTCEELVRGKTDKNN